MVIEHLLHYANSDPPTVGRDRFYALKSRLLERYAARDGEDVQRIVDRCWGWRDEDDCKGTACTKCGGTGIYRETFVLLRRYRWGRYVFHRPIGQPGITPFGRAPTIQGRIQHARYGRRPYEAVLWLYLLTGEWGLLLRAMRSSSCVGWYAWPMLTVQRVVFRVSLYASRRRCWCGRMFWTFGSGWQICRDCRRQCRPHSEFVPDDLPF